MLKSIRSKKYLKNSSFCTRKVVLIKSKLDKKTLCTQKFAMNYIFGCTVFLLLLMFSFFFHIFRDFASTETIDTSALASKRERLENLDQANAEIEKLRKLGEKLTGELQGKSYNLIRKQTFGYYFSS